MPLGSSSEAPVMRPGPRIFKSLGLVGATTGLESSGSSSSGSSGSMNKPFVVPVEAILDLAVPRSGHQRPGRRQARMLHINDITLRLGPRVLFDKATVALPPN